MQNMDLWQSVLARDAQHVELLVTDGEVDVNERNDLGETALHLAASRGFDDVVEVLLVHGADVALRDWESGWTALHRSVHHANLSTTLMLLRHVRTHLGRQFMKEYLHDTKDFAHQSAMEIVTISTTIKNQNEYALNEFALLEQFYENLAQDGEVDDEEHPTVLTSKRRGGMVYTFGKVDFQLGYHLPHVNVQSSPRLVELPITSPTIQISASKFHTIALNDRGQVYVWGFGKGGRLGTGTEFDHVEPTRLMSLDEIPIARVAAGENHTLALSRSGQVFSWGSNSFGQLGHNVKTATHESRLMPKRVDAFRGMVMSEIAASGTHSAAICQEDGCLYTWGSNKRGQLGRKDGFGVDQPNATPKRVDRLVPGHALSVIYESYDALRVTKVAMSDVHTCVVLRCVRNGQSHGQVWQFGYGSNVPTRVLFKEKRRTNSHLLMNQAWMPRWKLRSDDIVDVSCAPNHSIALSSCGTVYTWGHNGDALSHPQSKKDAAQLGAPQRVRLDKFGTVVSICASQDHCAVVTEGGDLVSWGCGPQGVLGHGPGNSWQPIPKHVHGAKKVVAVAAGHQHTVLLVVPHLPPNRAVGSPPANSPPKLRNLLESKIADFLDISNAATVWKYANTYSQLGLEQYCIDYMRFNWDAILEMGGKERLDLLFDLMLPPARQVLRDVNLVLEEKAAKAKSFSEKMPTRVERPPRKTSVSAVDERNVLLAPSEKEPATSVPQPSKLSVASPVMKPQATPGSRRKPSKFVSVDEFFTDKKDIVKLKASAAPTGTTSFLSPWSVAPSPPPPAAAAFPAGPTPTKSSSTLFPSLGDSLARPPRKESMDRYGTSPKLSFMPSSSPHLMPRKQVLGQDGAERSQASSFSLDAFIKKSSRKKSRSDSIDQPKPIWGGASPATTEAVAEGSGKKTLTEIQAEEEARLAAEAAAKARNGGFIRKSSTLNSWGLVEQQKHISLAELQKREEEERFLEEQRQILAQIERENKQREAEEKRRTAWQSKLSRDSHSSKKDPKNSGMERSKKGKAKKGSNEPREGNDGKAPGARGHKLERKLPANEKENEPQSLSEGTKKAKSNPKPGTSKAKKKDGKAPIDGDQEAAGPHHAKSRGPARQGVSNAVMAA